MKISVPLLYPEWPCPQNVKACMTLKTSLPLSISKTSDTSLEKIEHDRRLLSATIKIPSQPIWLKQTHSANPVPAVNDFTDHEADASFSSHPNQVCVILTADCLPILICDEQGKNVAAIHAGWRGLAAGVIENTVKALPNHPENFIAWLGPAIGPYSFEVGQDVYDAFTKNNPEALKAFVPKHSDKWLANLYLLAQQRLNNLGITKIHGGHFDTFTDSIQFYSYRRDGVKTGRMATFIWITE